MSEANVVGTNVVDTNVVNGSPVGAVAIAAAATSESLFGEVIYSYTRKQAIEDGVLVDVSSMAKEAGFKFPVALTSAVYEDCVVWGDEDNKRQTHQDVDGRLWDVLWMASLAARSGGREIRFSLYRVPRGGRGHVARLVTLKAICGPGDDAEPVVTVMQETED